MRVLKIKSLPDEETNWIDSDYVMLHACFQILEDCVVEEGVDTHCNYDTHKTFVDEVRFLYNWWQTRKTDSGFDNRQVDDEMLMRLMKIRSGLWT